MSNELWVGVPDYEGLYEVSTLGRFRNASTGRILKSDVMYAGYCLVKLYKNRKPHTFRAHRLVLRAFVGECPDGEQARHLNGIRSNNRESNLAWGTPAENHGDQVRHGTARAHFTGKHHLDNPNGKLSAANVSTIAALVPIFGQKPVAQIFGVHQSTVSHALRRAERRL